MHAHIHVYIHAFPTHTESYTQACAHTHTLIHLFMPAYIHTLIHTCIHTCIHAHMHTYIHTFCKDNRPMIANRCAYEYKGRQARYHTVQETNVSHMSLGHACSLHLSVSHSNRSETKRRYRMEHHSCSQLCTHDSFDWLTSFAVGIFHSSVIVPFAASRE